MLMKRISKLKHTKGAVLFAVIAVMALLIAMASTAYYTARSAYNTVVSNYNFSQLYLSAISVSDMVAEAITNDSVAAATGASPTTGVVRNNFDDLRDAILTMETIGQKVTVYSNGITEANATAANTDAILQELSTKDSVISGALDGIIVSIELLDNTQYMPISPNPQDLGGGHYCYWFKYDYKFTTTAFYGNNYIIVEDVVASSKSKIWTPDPGQPGSPGSPAIPGQPPVPGTPGTPGNSNVTFDTFFTATGQIIHSTDGQADIGRTSQIVKISSHVISDDAFFQNENTFFGNLTGNNNDNAFQGAVTSTGSIYLDHAKPKVKGNNNDWFIGKDLVLLDTDASKLDLTNGGQYDNSLYVGRDLVIGTGNAEISATDIYVEGDLYILGGNAPSFKGNLHVNGDIYYVMDDRIVDENGVERDSPTKIASDNGYDPASKWGTPPNTFSGDVSIKMNGYDLDVGGEFDDGGTGKNLKIEGLDGTVDISTGKDVSDESGGNIGEFDFDSKDADDMVQITNRVPNSETDTFVDVTGNPQSVGDAITSQSGSNKEYNNYTAGDDAYKSENTIKIDFGNLDTSKISETQEPDLDANGNYQYNDDGTLKTKTVYIYTDSDKGLKMNLGSNDGAGTKYKGPVTIEIDASKDKYKNGLMLDIDGDLKNYIDTNITDISYEIKTPDDTTVPIVLKDNTTAPDGSKGFSWKGDGYEDNAKGVDVKIMGTGNIVFEMANFDKDSGDYKPYKADDYDEYDSVQYIAASKEIIGTEAQVDYLKSSSTDPYKPDVDGMYANKETGTPKDEYFNRIMFVSNKNDGTAFDAARQDNIFCGYIYAPNGHYNNMSGDGGNPLFGGMIVSTYHSNIVKLYYAEPKPSLVNAMLGSLTSSVPGGGNGGTPATPDIPGTPDIPATPGTPPTPPPGTGTWGTPTPADFWDIEGSNYVG